MSTQQFSNFDVLCLAARPDIYHDVELLRRAADGPVDWPAVVAGAQRNRVTRLVLDSLQQCGSPRVPSETIEALRNQAVVAASRSLTKIPDIEKLATAFDGSGIRYLIVKGIPLSIQIYGDVSRRPADDIDVLVSPDQFWHADAILRKSGYCYDIPPPAVARQLGYLT